MTSARPRVLLVEDNPDNRGLIRQAVEDLDLELLEAVNGEEGVRLARAARPALVLMDLSLPVMSGWEAAAVLKADPTTAHIPVVAVTAHAMAGDEQRARDVGCDGYLAKPISLLALHAMLEAHLGPLAPADEGLAR